METTSGVLTLASGPREAPAELVSADARRTRRHVRTQASGKAAIFVAALTSLMWLVVNSQALIAFAMGLVFAVALDGYLAFRALDVGTVEVTPVSPPTAGEASTWSLRVERVRRPLLVRLAGEPGVVTRRRKLPPVLIERSGSTALTLPPQPRGIFFLSVIDVVANGPVGLCRAGRRFQVIPPHPQVVRPHLADDDRAELTPRGSLIENNEVRPHGDDLFRGIRPYVRGDEPRKIHWKATARERELMVREEDGTGLVSVQVTVDLPTDRTRADTVVAVAARVVDNALRLGWIVQLVTMDAPPRPSTVAALRSPFRRPPQVLRHQPVPDDVETVAQHVTSIDTTYRQLATASSGTVSAPPWAGLRCTVSETGVTWS